MITVENSKKAWEDDDMDVADSAMRKGEGMNATELKAYTRSLAKNIVHEVEKQATLTDEQYQKLLDEIEKLIAELFV